MAYSKITFDISKLGEIYQDIKISDTILPTPLLKNKFSIIVLYNHEIRIELDGRVITLYLDYYRDEYWGEENPDLIIQNFKNEGGVEVKFEEIRQDDVILFKINGIFLFVQVFSIFPSIVILNEVVLQL